MNKKIVLFLLGIILAIAIILRVWQLGSVPSSPDWDEAALGYNAYSILQTGKDEYGKFLPVILRSFDDYKPALYTYLIIPLLLVFDLNISVVRFPAAFFGVLAVLATYFLVKELVSGRYREQISLLSAFFLAISPWHLQFSRIAFETQVGLAFNIFSILFFLKGLKKPYFLLFSAFFAALSIHTYQSEKVYLPILFIVLLAIYWREIIRIPKKWLGGAVILGLVILSPLFIEIMTNQNVLLRAKGVSVFSNQTEFLKRNVLKYNVDKENNDILGLIVNNRRVEYGKAVVAGYIAHYDLNWLFITGDNERHHAPYMGLLYLFELPLLLVGIYIVLFGNISRKAKLTIFAIFLIAPIPASVTSGVPHAVRTINFLPTFQIFTAFGLLYFVLYLAQLKRIVAFTAYGIFGLLVLLNFMYYLNQYFVQQNYYFSEYWQYGYKEAIDYIKPIAKNYDTIVVSNKAPLDQSYMFFLFYYKYNPLEYQKLGGTVSGGFAESHKGFNNFVFRPIEWEKEDKQGVLFIGRPNDIPESANILHKISYLNGKPAIVIADEK
jgi:4-amino-4-deoxy-L-arabinose transferase-like glycosyltransferase